jgi:hypothetical protein
MKSLLFKLSKAHHKYLDNPWSMVTPLVAGVLIGLTPEKYLYYVVAPWLIYCGFGYFLIHYYYKNKPQ